MAINTKENEDNNGKYKETTNTRLVLLLEFEKKLISNSRIPAPL
jgi:hypothetical protein